MRPRPLTAAAPRSLQWPVSGGKEVPASQKRRCTAFRAVSGELPHIRGMNLELTDEQTEALIRELSQLIDGDRYPLSPRIVALKEILGMLRPEPERAPLPPRRHYELPSKGRYGRRRG
jgi:hypothetical protein